MTMYRDIYQDLPSRVYEIWQRAKEAQKKEKTDLRVTAMLMAAAAGFAMPFENLRYERAGNKSNWDDHPAFHGCDQAQYQKSLKACNDLLKKPIPECPGLAGASLLQCKELRDIRDAAGSGKGHATVNTEKHDTRFALGILRNALAHNNIVDVPDGANEIEKLAFFSKDHWCDSCGRKDGWNVLLISVNAFEQFLDAWFALLQEPGSFVGAAAAVAND